MISLEIFPSASTKLMSASDLETHIKSKGKLGRISSCYMLITVHDSIYNLFICFIHTLLYTL